MRNIVTLNWDTGEPTIVQQRVDPATMSDKGLAWLHGSMPILIEELHQLQGEVAAEVARRREVSRPTSPFPDYPPEPEQ